MKPHRPLWLRLLPSGLVVSLATLGPVGRVKKAPGTAGSVAGLIWFTIFFHQLNIVGFMILGGISVAVAIIFCGEAEVRLKKIDPPEVVLDEFVAIPFCFAGLHAHLWQGDGGAWLIILTGFLLFRFFDIVKPLGIRRLQRLEGGIGVVADDLAAAFATAICLHILVLTTPFFA